MISGEIQAGERLALALAGSLILHFALMFGIQLRPLPEVQAAPTMIQARLVDPPQSPPTEASPPPAPPEPETLQLRQDHAIAEPPPEMPHESVPVAGAAPPEAVGNLPSIAVPLIEDPTYYPASQVDVHPTALQAILPAYPEAAAKSGITGSVVLLLLLDESGTVQDISVEEASPPGYFEESAMAAFRNARFSPAQRNGKVVKSRVRLKVTYDLVEISGKAKGSSVPGRGWT